MRRDQQVYLADLVRDHRAHLEQVMDKVVEREAPLSALEAHLLIEASDVRLVVVENTLRYDPEHVTRQKLVRDRLRRILARIRSWAKPRLGIQAHYSPRPLRVPARYLETTPPDPAPSVSIVTPSYQQGRFIDRTLHSVLGQRYPELEYYVQDGGSTDETIEVLRRFEAQLSGWASESDGGQADAINRGFERTTGEIMAWLNSDDILLPGALAYVARYFVEHPDVDVVYGHRVMIDESDGQIGAWVLPRHNDRALMFADYIPQETLFWRRRIWDASGGSVDLNFGYALDWDLLLRFRDVGAKIVRLPRFLGAFRIHGQQKTSAADVLGLEEMARLRERVHGRPVPIGEALVQLRSYFLRHIAVHSRQRFVDRLPLRRAYVLTSPSGGPVGVDDASLKQALIANGDGGPSPLVPQASSAGVHTDGG
jgi:glycosyltransferase involved in cell wall biosynthesis